jgi:hypothetical protein
MREKTPVLQPDGGSSQTPGPRGCEQKRAGSRNPPALFAEGNAVPRAVTAPPRHSTATPDGFSLWPRSRELPFSSVGGPRRRYGEGRVRYLPARYPEIIATHPRPVIASATKSQKSNPPSNPRKSMCHRSSIAASHHGTTTSYPKGAASEAVVPQGADARTEPDIPLAFGSKVYPWICGSVMAKPVKSLDTSIARLWH